MNKSISVEIMLVQGLESHFRDILGPPTPEVGMLQSPAPGLAANEALLPQEPQPSCSVLARLELSPWTAPVMDEIHFASKKDSMLL